MTVSYYTSDRSAISHVQQRAAARAYRDQYQPAPDFSALMAAYVDAYPDADPRVLYSLAASGQAPNDPAVQAALQASFDNDRSKGIFDRIGDVLSPVTAAVGAVTGPLARGADAVLGEVDETLTPALKTAVRTGFVVLESPLQELQSFSRAGLATVLNPRQGAGWGKGGSSSLREIMGGELGWDDLGEGFLPGGEVEESVKTKAGQLKVTVNDVDFGGPGNPAITLGRVAAATVSEPGEASFNIISGLVDAGVAWYGDPASALGTVAKTAEVGTRVSRAVRAGRSEGSLAAAGTELLTKPTFAKVTDRSLQGRAIENITGRIAGTRKTVETDVAAQWVSKGGRRVEERIAETGDIYDLRSALGKDFPAELLVPLADADTPQAVHQILEPHFGIKLRMAPEFNGFKVRRNNKASVRILGEMPGPTLDPQNLNDALDQVDRVLVNAKASTDLRRKAANEIARNPDIVDMKEAMFDVMGDLADELAGTVKGGTARARQLTQLWNKDFDFVRTYFIDEIAENRKVPGVKVGTDTLELQTPFLASEYLNSVIPLPDAREIRRATSGLNKWVDTPFFERAVSALDSGQSAWKRITLLRGAYTARVIGEEQLRMAVSGLDSVFAHPLSFIAGLVADDGRLGKVVRNAGRRDSDVLGTRWEDESGNPVRALRDAMNEQQYGGWVDQRRVVSDEWRIYNRDEDGYLRAWADGIGELAFDDIAQRVAQADGNLDVVLDWMMHDPEGNRLRNVLKTNHPDMDTRYGTAQYLNTLWEGIQYRTNGDPLLMDAIATGMFDDAPIGRFDTHMRWSNSDRLMAHLENTPGPAAIKGRRAEALAERVGWFDNATSWAFQYLSTKPTNYLSRSQTFKQRYWQRIGEMVPFMDDTTRQRAIDAALDAKLPADQIKRMRNATPNTNRPLDNLADADQVAKTWAVDETKKLLYDLSDRGQFFDTFRLLFPFGEAWKEVMTRWAKIGAENPKIFRRGQQVITGARGNGFFHKDADGNEVFTYPFSRQLSNLLVGVPVDLTGRVAGLSLMTEVLPGVGPVVQVPAAALLPDTPDWDFAREFMFPFGETDYSRGFLESFAPGYLKNVIQFFEGGDKRLFANTTMQVYDYLASTGDYDLSNQGDTARMLEDAREYAKGLYLFRGMAQFVSPTSPLPQTLLEGPEGDELLVRREVVKDLHRFQERLGYEAGTAEFVNRYGVEFLRFTEGMSTSIGRFLPVSPESAEWERSHQSVVDDYKLVWGLFAPSGDDLDMAAYSRQLERGDRKPLTPEQRAELANAAVGNHIWKQAQAKVGDNPSKAGREWLALVKEKLREEYPGFKATTPGMPARATTGQVVQELYAAVNDKRLKGTRQAKAARAWLAAREQAINYIESQGLQGVDSLTGSISSAAGASSARRWLGLVAQRLKAQFPEFSEFFDTVFSYEVDI